MIINYDTSKWNWLPQYHYKGSLEIENTNTELGTIKDIDGNMAIDIICENGEPFDDLTTNLDFLMPFYAYVQDSTYLIDFIDEYKLGKPTGAKKCSGFNTYSLYEFDPKELEKYATKNSDYTYMKYM